MQIRTKPQDINWVTWAVSLLLIGLSVFYGQDAVDCRDQGFVQQLIHSLIHISVGHLLINLWSFYELSYLEHTYGSLNYFLLLVSLLVISSGIYWLINTYVLGSPICSIGFSGVILGLMGWARMLSTEGRLDLNEFQRWLVILIGPIIQNPRISLLGHASGLIAGLFLHWIVGVQT